MHIEIKNAEISRSIFLKWEYDQTEEGRKTNVKASADAPIHEDLQDAFDQLAPHFVLLTEMKKKPDVAKLIDLKNIDEELLKKFKVRGFAVEEKNGESHILLSGYKILNTGKTVKFQTPKTNRGNKDEGYEFYDQLLVAIENLKEEIMEYMEGKCSEHYQASMDFEGEEEDAAEDFTPQIEETETVDNDNQAA